MSKPIEPTLFGLPAELGVLVASSLPSGDLLSLRRASTQGRDVVQLHLKDLWNFLERSPPAGPLDLKDLTGSLRLYQRGAPLLHLFKRLTRAFAGPGKLPYAIALTSIDFEELQKKSQAAYDEALTAVWPRILAALNIPNPQISAAKEIRAWLNDPNHAVLLSGITQLDLSKLQLKVLPLEITKLSQLRWLCLANNQLTSLLDSIGSLSQLRNFYLSCNPLTSLPDAIGSLSQLKWLNVGTNQLTSLPDTIGNLSQLEWLCLAHNQLTSLPDAIGNLSQLECLYLEDNQLTSLPDSIGNLSRLQFGSLMHNRLTVLPDAIKKLDRFGV